MLLSPIADTSFLIAFSAIDRLDVLQAVVENVLIPPSVRLEIVDQGAGWEAAGPVQQAINDSRWIHPIPAPPRIYLDEIQALLGATGEAEVVASGLALQPEETLLLIDEKQGRSVALAKGLSVIGSLGILGRAKSQGVVPAAAPLIRRMVERGLYFDRNLIETFLAGLDETWEP